MQGLEFAIAVFDILKLTLGHDFEFDFVGELIGGERSAGVHTDAQGVDDVDTRYGNCLRIQFGEGSG